MEKILNCLEAMAIIVYLKNFLTLFIALGILFVICCLIVRLFQTLRIKIMQ